MVHRAFALALLLAVLPGCVVALGSGNAPYPEQLSPPRNKVSLKQAEVRSIYVGDGREVVIHVTNRGEASFHVKAEGEEVLATVEPGCTVTLHGSYTRISLVAEKGDTSASYMIETGEE